MDRARILLLGDLHGNMTATMAMEQELKELSPDEVWFLGDAVGKGPENAEACDWVREHCQYFVGGNWDYGIAGDWEAAFYKRQLGEERLKWLRELPMELELTVSGICFRVFHGRPVTPQFQGFTDEEIISGYFQANGKTYGGLISADTHRPYIRSLQAGYVINTGSVGNSHGVAKAHALLIEGVKDSVREAPVTFSILSVPYDNEAEAAVAMRYPDMPRQEAYISEIRTGVYSKWGL
ncbi:MAG: metallophosphoesterase family protein [Lachnospiraceae bacterium]|nr:metallophosphoesterase family protein [Lachnospiraceae bacterium]